MIDFTKCKEELNNYKGSEKKKTLIYEGKRYLVKFPDPIIKKNKNISFINNAFSEYIGSNIFKMIGFETQNTILGKYIYNNKEKIVCACEDFTYNKNCILYEFENIVLSANLDKKIDNELADIIEVIDNSDMLDKKEIKEKFWDMFIVDDLIGNSDRHNANWGFLLDRNDNISFSPIYDCGSCLNPLLEDEEISKLTDTDIKNLALNCYSCITENNKKINYMSYIKSRKNEECNKALKRIFKKIDINKIKSFIDDIECISEERKEFYKKIICMRYEIMQEVYKNNN